jgi:hypothetical protein
MVFGKLLSALKKTRDVLTAGLARLFSGRKLDDAFLEDLEEVLYNSDLGPVGTRVVDELKGAYKRREIKETAEVPAFLKTKLVAMLNGTYDAAATWFYSDSRTNPLRMAGKGVIPTRAAVRRRPGRQPEGFQCLGAIRLLGVQTYGGHAKHSLRQAAGKFGKLREPGHGRR